jgi:hypothetical protein
MEAEAFGGRVEKNIIIIIFKLIWNDFFLERGSGSSSRLLLLFIQQAFIVVMPLSFIPFNQKNVKGGLGMRHMKRAREQQQQYHHIIMTRER